MNKEFEGWFLKSDYRELVAEHLKIVLGQSILKRFYALPISMQKGVYEEFFKSKGIQIGVDLLDIDKAFEILMLKEFATKMPDAAKAGEALRNMLT